MAHYHPSDRKIEALQYLLANGGDIAATHRQTGIPPRTLYTWRAELRKQRKQQRHTLLQLPPPPEMPHFEDPVDGLIFLRHEIVSTLHRLFRTTTDFSPYVMLDRIRAEVSLVDCVIKLDDFLRPYPKMR